MKITRNFWMNLTAVLLSISIISCGSEPEPIVEQEIIELNNEDEYKDEINFIMPSPLQIAAIFKRAGLTYSNEAISNPDNVSKYTETVSKALNFGVYAADLSYCVLNKQSQDALKYMNAVKILSDDLGMASMFGSSDMFRSFENNLDNEDSLIYILATIQENLDEHLEQDEQQYMSVVFFAGGWTEGMHIGSRVAEEGKPSIASRLIEQMVILENMIEALENFPHESPIIDDIVVQFKDIDATYRNFESLKNVDMDEVSFADLKITDAELNLVVQKVEKLREKIISGK